MAALLFLKGLAMKLVVTAKELRYGGRQMRAGDEFEASDKDARTLKAVRKAADAPPAQVKRSMPQPPEPKPVEPAASEEDQPRRRGRPSGAAWYGRRDMRAEE